MASRTAGSLRSRPREAGPRSQAAGPQPDGTATGAGTRPAAWVRGLTQLADPAKAAAIHDYLKLLNQAYVWGASHVPVWASVWAKATGLPDAVMLNAARDDVRTPVQITLAVVSAEQSVSNAFSTSGLIPGHVDFKNFSYSGFNDTVGGA